MTRKIFTVYIHEKPYDVLDIPGKEHEGYNDMPKTWWLHYADQLEDLAALDLKSERLVPYTKSVDRRLWEINMKQRNTCKVKWDDFRFSNSTWTSMVCNGKTVYEFPTVGGERGLAYAMAKVQYLIVELSEHPYDFFEPENNQGRKIFYYGLPATVRVHSSSTWEISIVPDYSTGISEPAWWGEYRMRRSTAQTVEDITRDEDRMSESRSDGYINWGSALSDGNINWFRN